jgi:hypothetical protein
MKAYRGLDVQIHVFLTSAQFRAPAALTLRMGPRGGLNDMEK